MENAVGYVVGGYYEAPDGVLYLGRPYITLYPTIRAAQAAVRRTLTYARKMNLNEWRSGDYQITRVQSR